MLKQHNHGASLMTLFLMKKLVDRAIELAEKIALGAPLAIQYSKRTVYETMGETPVWPSKGWVFLSAMSKSLIPAKMLMKVQLPLLKSASRIGRVVKNTFSTWGLYSSGGKYLRICLQTQTTFHLDW